MPSRVLLAFLTVLAAAGALAAQNAPSAPDQASASKDVPAADGPFFRTTFAAAEGYATTWRHCPSGEAAGSRCQGGWDMSPLDEGERDKLGNTISVQVNSTTRDGLHPHGDEILEAANHAEGGGGLGFRHYKTRTNGSGGSAGGGLRVAWEKGHRELWFRWYQRWLKNDGTPGFTWDRLVTEKSLYFNVNERGKFVIIGFYQERSLWFAHVTANAGRTNILPNLKARTFGDLGDGKWHLLETHLKVDTNGKDGVLEMWADGVRTLAHDDVDFNGADLGTLFTHVAVGSNNFSADFGYTDYDDLAASAKGPIGPYDRARGF